MSENDTGNRDVFRRGLFAIASSRVTDSNF